MALSTMGINQAERSNANVKIYNDRARADIESIYNFMHTASGFTEYCDAHNFGLSTRDNFFRLLFFAGDLTDQVANVVTDVNNYLIKQRELNNKKIDF